MMKKLHLLILLIVLITLPAWGQEKRKLTVDDFAAIRDVSHPQLSPDGKMVVYMVDSTDLKEDKSYTDLYMIPASGGEEVQLTSDQFDGPHPGSAVPQWSPDNKYLAYVAKRDKKPQIFLLKRSGGVATQLTDVKQRISGFQWSPDSKKLAILMTDVDPNDTDSDKDAKKTPPPLVITRIQFKFDTQGYLTELRNHIYLFNIDTKEMKQVTSGPWDDSSPKWSPDGTQILFVSNRSENPDTNRNTDLFLVPAAGGEPKKLTTNFGPDSNPDWSPDGKWIAYTTGLHPEWLYYEASLLAVIPSTGGTPKVLTQDLDRNAFRPHFSPDSKRIYFLLEDQGTQRIASVSVSGGNFNKQESSEKVVFNFDVNPNGLVYTASRPDLPYEVFAGGLKQKTQAQITKVNSAVLSRLNLGKVEPILFHSKDGTPVSGYVVKPPDFDPAKKYPLINWIHGGPTSQYTDEFDFTPQLFAAQGYVVTLINYRGSFGYGQEFCKSIFADWGDKEIDDLMAGVDSVIAKGYIDTDRMGVGGWSYGGILTDWTILKSQRFKCAAAGAGIGNALSGYGTDHYQYEYEKELGFPWENLDAYLKVSAPFLKLNQIKTPTLFMCGEKDMNVPLLNSEQMYQGMRRLGIDTMLIIYPGERHSISTPTHLKDRYERYLAWFGHFLKGEANKVPPAPPKKEESKE